MKSINFSLLATIILFVTVTFCSQQVSAQEITHLRTHRMGTDASISWGSSNPLGVVYFLIERSYDGEIFENVAEISATDASSYKYRDISVLPGMISYRVTSFNIDGSSSQSAVDVLRLLRKR